MSYLSSTVILWFCVNTLHLHLYKVQYYNFVTFWYWLLIQNFTLCVIECLNDDILHWLIAANDNIIKIFIGCVVFTTIFTAVMGLIVWRKSRQDKRPDLGEFSFINMTVNIVLCLVLIIINPHYISTLLHWLAFVSIFYKLIWLWSLM